MLTEYSKKVLTEHYRLPFKWYIVDYQFNVTKNTYQFKIDPKRQCLVKIFRVFALFFILFTTFGLMFGIYFIRNGGLTEILVCVSSIAIAGYIVVYNIFCVIKGDYCITAINHILVLDLKLSN